MLQNELTQFQEVARQLKEANQMLETVRLECTKSHQVHVDFRLNTAWISCYLVPCWS